MHRPYKTAKDHQLLVCSSLETLGVVSEVSSSDLLSGAAFLVAGPQVSDCLKVVKCYELYEV